jgi:hypothetical protein
VVMTGSDSVVDKARAASAKAVLHKPLDVSVPPTALQAVFEGASRSLIKP